MNNEDITAQNHPFNVAVRLLRTCLEVCITIGGHDYIIMKKAI